MTKTRSTKRALLLSALSLLMCVSMLVGSTFAWFTDSVTSGKNTIQSGNLDIQLLMYDGTEYIDISNSDLPIFGAGSIAQNKNSETLWEPGKTQVAYLAIKNNGSLSLKYKVALDVYTTIQDHKNLYEVMEYAIVPDAQPNEVKSWTSGNNVVLGEQVVSGDNDVPMDPGSVHYFALAIHMPEEADNRYQNGEVSFDLTVLATQLDAEFDSFGKDYDEDARYPLGVPATVTAEVDAGFKFEANIPAEAPAYNYGLKVVLNEFTNDKTNATLKFDVSLVDRNNNDKEISVPTLEYPVTIQLPHPFVNMDNFQLFHGEESVSGAVYDEATRTISFTTTGFSPFELKYIDYADPTFELDYAEQNGQYTIKKGMFFVNPVNYFADGSVLGKSAVMAADHIAVDFTKDEVKYYIVSNQKTTVFAAADTTAEYKCDNGTFTAENVDFRTSQSGKLQSLIAEFNKKEFTTVYLLPGTYKEAATVYIRADMDIIGLGDTEDVKVYKTLSSDSNRHLLNVTGSESTEYIEVTIRNLYLNATTNTDGKKKGKPQDNAAVQAYDIAKVKCYDLVIEKEKDPTETGFWNENAALYVNGNNRQEGAFMYVENCTISSNYVLSVKYPYIFRYSNLKIKGGTQDYSGSGQNLTLSPNDWWD